MNAQENMEPRVTEIWEPQPEVIEPGSGQKPPSDAIVLFDGKDLSGWENEEGGPAEWNVQDGYFTVKPGAGMIYTKKSFGDIQLHIEFMCPADDKGEGQGRGNSGIFLQKRYELQVLDSYQNKTYANGQAGAIYKQHPPRVNACRKPGEWQRYDIVFTAPRFNEKGQVITPAYITVFHNGAIVQNHVQIQGITKYIGYPEYKAHDLEQPLGLQDHGDLVSFRNIWVRKL